MNCNKQELFNMDQKEKKLALFHVDTDLAVRKPQLVVKSIAEFNEQVYNYFETEKFLLDVNNRFFNNKGTIEKSPYYGINIEEGSLEGKEKKSRFDRFFSVNGNLTETTLKVSLLVKSTDLLSETSKPFDFLSLIVLHSIDTVENLFVISVKGEIVFIKSRDYRGGGNFSGDKSFYLVNMGEGCTLCFPLANPPHSDSVFPALTQNVAEILRGFEAQGYIKIPEKATTDSADMSDTRPTKVS